MDIGTNSTRLLVAEVGDSQRLHSKARIIMQQIRITRIGEGMKTDRRIKEEPLERTIAALKEYRRILEENQVEDYRIVATSAMRDALNRDEILERIYKETGFSVEIIEGSREAELSYLGAVSDFPGRNAVIDIGGGSTEVVYEAALDPQGSLVYTSTDLGGVRLLENPELRTEIIALLKANIPDQEQLRGLELVGVGGTATTIAAIFLGMTEYDWEKIHGLVLSREKIEEIGAGLRDLTLEERKKVPGLEPERADIIVYGIDILLAFMKEYGFSEMRVSDKDLLFALLQSGH